MKMRLRYLVLAAIALSALAGCGGGGEGVDEPTPETTAGGEGDTASGADAAESADATEGVDVQGDLPYVCDDPRVFFAFDSAELDAHAKAKLDGLVRCVKRQDVEEIEIIGRADPRGPEPYNQDLGRRRAEAVADYLEDQGATRPEIDIASRGEEDAHRARVYWILDRRAVLETD